MSEDTEVRMIPIDQIQIVNPRVRDRKKFESIISSIAQLGLKRPITVTPSKEGVNGQTAYDLVCGQGRLEAFISLGQREIPAFVRPMSKTDGLLASLIENIARRKVRALEQIRTIEWMREQGNDAAAIANKTALSEGYVKQVLRLLRSGEERLLDAVLHGRIPITIATQMCGESDEESQKILMAAYEAKELNQKTLREYRRLVDQRRNLGRTYEKGKRGSGSSRTSAESLVLAYRQETQRQRLMVKKAKTCEARLLSLAAGFRVLMADEDFVNLLRAEKINTMPKFLAERAKANP